MAIGVRFGRGAMGSMESAGTGARECSCSILSAREEKLLDDEGRVEVRLICNRCGNLLDSEVLPPLLRSPPGRSRATEAEAAEGA